MIRRYHELSRIETFEERYEYLRLTGSVGASTFGFDRWINQQFYRSAQWKSVRNFVIVRDSGCDLGVPGYEIHDQIFIHHMNPMTVDQVKVGDAGILDPDFLISTTQRTHNAIHYGDSSQLPRTLTVRTAGDTKLW